MSYQTVVLVVTAILCFANLFVLSKDGSKSSIGVWAWIYVMAWLGLSILCWYQLPGYSWIFCACTAVCIVLLFLVTLLGRSK